MRIGCSGLVRSATGIGVDQRYIYPRLQSRGHHLVLSASRDPGDLFLAPVRGLARGFLARTPGADVYLSFVPPTPWKPGAPIVAVIHDLRWLRTRRGLGRLYRRWDLHRTVKKSAALVCISQRTCLDLESFDASAVGKTHVVHLGPGLVAEDDFLSNDDGIVLLVGGGSHKRNELAARLLVDASPVWCKRVIGVGISQSAQNILLSGFGDGRIELFERPSDDDMRSIYKRASIFFFLGQEEGFGLPYLEALASGCEVIAVDQPLTRELLGAAAVLLTGRSRFELLEELQQIRFPPEATRLTQARKYSWDRCADALIGILASESHAEAPT